MLDDVGDVIFDLPRLQHLPAVPRFVLKNVSRFSISHSRSLPDTRRDDVVTEEKL